MHTHRFPPGPHMTLMVLKLLATVCAELHSQDANICNLNSLRSTWDEQQYCTSLSDCLCFLYIITYWKPYQVCCFQSVGAFSWRRRHLKSDQHIFQCSKWLWTEGVTPRVVPNQLSVSPQSCWTFFFNVFWLIELAEQPATLFFSFTLTVQQQAAIFLSCGN